MKGNSHLITTKQAFNIHRQIFGTTSLYFGKETVAQQSVNTDDFDDLEFVNVWWGKDNPHETSVWDVDDEAHYARGSRNFCAFNHFIDIKKSAGIYDDYDGYSYEHGSASSGEYQTASDATDDWLEWIAAAISGYKVDEGINWWFNDEYVHAPGQSWYDNCSPSVEHYCYYQDMGKFSSKEAELVERFPRADNTGKKGKGIPYSVFMPVDNLARYWYAEFKKTPTLKKLGPVMHAIQDASVPHHAAGYNGNWHGEYEGELKTYIQNNNNDADVVSDVKALVDQWNRIDNNPPPRLTVADKDMIPAKNWEIETLVTWVALNACDEYINSYNNFKNGFVINNNSMKKLTTIALAMSTLLLIKANEDTDGMSIVQKSFVGNVNSKELHRRGCYWVAQMSEDNKVPFTTVEEALSQGYNGCFYCLKAYDNG